MCIYIYIHIYTYDIIYIYIYAVLSRSPARRRRSWATGRRTPAEEGGCCRFAGRRTAILFKLASYKLRSFGSNLLGSCLCWGISPPGNKISIESKP